MSSIWYAITTVSFGVSANAGSKAEVQSSGLTPAAPSRVRRFNIGKLPIERQASWAILHATLHAIVGPS